jgi:hypothetical protein
MRPPVAATNASTVPSPPSAIGTKSHTASGSAAFSPSAIACATSLAEALPLKLSGAMTNRINTHHRTTATDDYAVQKLSDMFRIFGSKAGQSDDEPASLPDRSDISVLQLVYNVLIPCSQTATYAHNRLHRLHPAKLYHEIEATKVRLQ